MAPITDSFRLALACAVWPPSAAREEGVRRAALAVENRDSFIRIVRRHRIAGLAQDGLKRAGLAVPEAVAQMASQMAFQGLKLAGETRRLQSLFDQAATPVVFIKGASLAQAAYGDIGLRHGKDIDAVVGLEDVEAAWAILAGEGYQRVIPPPGLSPAQTRLFFRLSKDSAFFHTDRGVEVELHWRLSDNLDAAAVPAATTWREVQISGGQTIRTFADEDLFVYLCVHGSGHGWMRLKWLADIGALLNSAPDAPERYWRAAKAAGQGISVAVAMRLAGRLLGAPVPPAVAASRSRRVRLLESLALWAMTAGGGEVELHRVMLGRFVEPLAGMLLIRDWTTRLKLLFKLVVPIEDMLMVRLPGPLHFLYPLLRLPLWLWKLATRRR